MESTIDSNTVTQIGRVSPFMIISEKTLKTAGLNRTYRLAWHEGHQAFNANEEFDRNLSFFVRFFFFWILCAICLGSQARTAESGGYSKLSPDQKTAWQRLLFQKNSFLRPHNSNYYLTNLTPVNLIAEFQLVEQYLSGEKKYDGTPEDAPWCLFPARFFYVASTAGRFIPPEEWEACRLPFPAIDDSLKAYLVKTLEPADSGQALFHVELSIQGRRFYNGTALALTLNMGKADADPDNPDIFLLLNSLGEGKGRASITKDGLRDLQPTSGKTGWQYYTVNLSPKTIYFLALLGFETRRADFPYNLLKASCHTYIQNLLLAVAPESFKDQPRVFFDFLPGFMGGAGGDESASLLSPNYYRASALREVDAMANRLSWEDYQTFHDESPHKTDIKQLSRPLRLALGKRVDLLSEEMRSSPAHMALRDEYLDQLKHQKRQHLQLPPAEDGSTVPLYTSPYPSSISGKAVSLHGNAHLELEIDVFNTNADQLQGIRPYGFVLGKLNLVASSSGIAFDHLLFAQEKRIGLGCCGSWLYGLGFRRISDISVDIVNDPEASGVLPRPVFKPHLQLNITRGVGTAFRNGFSVQILPTMAVFTYGKHLSLNADLRMGWENGAVAISASKSAEIYRPTLKRNEVLESFSIEYKLSKRDRVELSYQSFGPSGSTTGLRYAFAF